MIVPTKNRKEPLSWLFGSLSKQKNVEYEKIIIVEDGSVDNTEKLVKRWSTRLPLVYLKNNSSKGFAASRNRGLNELRDGFVAFLDSDCYLMFPNTLCKVGATFFEKENVAAVGFPVYHRRNEPKGILPSNRIAKVELDQGLILDNTDYCPFDNDRSSKLIEATNLNGVFIADIEKIKKAGGFPEIPESGDWGCETKLALNLIELGYKLWAKLSPDCSVIHWKYGRPGEPSEGGFNEQHLLHMLKRSRESHEPISPGENVKSRIAGSCYVLKVSPTGLENYINRVFKTFVRKNDQTIYAGKSGYIKDEKKRRIVFESALELVL